MRMRHSIFTAFALFVITVAFIVTPVSAAFLVDLEDQHNLSNIGTIYGNGYPGGIIHRLVFVH